MTTFGVSMVKDEADVIEGTLRHLADEVDWMIVADNGSVDGTREILEKLATELPLTVLDDPEIGYLQSSKMSAMATMAADEGATWIVPFDADELWFCTKDNVHGPMSIRDQLAAQKREVNVGTVELFNHFATAIDPMGDNPFETMVWRQRSRAPLPKVAFRWESGAVIHQGNHGVSLPSGDWWVPLELEVRHFPYRSPDQMVRKAHNGAAAYRASDLPAEMGAHWRAYGEILDRLGEEALHTVFREHFWYLSPVDAGMVLDPAPYRRWQR